jgi:hypothetical protein
MKRQVPDKEKILENLSLIKDVCPEYIKKFQNATIRKPLHFQNLFWGRGGTGV